MMEDLYTRMGYSTQLEPNSNEESEIRKFYAGKTIFLSGCTDLLGTFVIEKLLRNCPKMKRLYVLVERKEERTIEEDLHEYFESELFDKLRKRSPNFEKIVTPLKGDLQSVDLGLSTESRDIIRREVNIIIHNAATENLDGKISRVLKINVLGTKQMLDLAVECTQLQAFIYVSTVYSNCIREEVEEEIESPPVNMKTIHDMIESDLTTVGLTKNTLKMIMGDWPDLYSFTKAQAESLVKEYSRKANFPCGVFRPAIVSSSYKEPIKGWFGSQNGLETGFLGTAQDTLDVAFSKNAVFDVVPADMCGNALLAVVWDLTTRWQSEKQHTVYNYSTVSVHPVLKKTWRELMTKESYNRPSMKAAWFHIMTVIYHYWLWLSFFLVHYVLAATVSCLHLVQCKKKTCPCHCCKKAKYYYTMVYFGKRAWRVKVSKMQRVWDQMNVIDSDLFYCDLRKLDWQHFAESFWNGIRLRTLKDSVDTIPTAKRKIEILKIVHFFTTAILLILVAYVIYLIFIAKEV